MSRISCFPLARAAARHRRRAGFTLVELLVVIGIIAVLISLLLPALSRSQAQATAVKCMANLRQIGVGLVAYATDNKGYLVPSYHLPTAPFATTNVAGGPDQPLEGWASILDRTGLVPTSERTTNSIFYCPNTVDVEGMKDGQTGTDQSKPRGWTDWPLKMTSVGGDSIPKVAVTIPDRGFNKIIRVSYWINAYNPIGSAVADIRPNDLHYTTSVGHGPDGNGKYLRYHRQSDIKRASDVIVLAAEKRLENRTGPTLYLNSETIPWPTPATFARVRSSSSPRRCWRSRHRPALPSPTPGRPRPPRASPSWASGTARPRPRPRQGPGPRPLPRQPRPPRRRGPPPRRRLPPQVRRGRLRPRGRVVALINP